MKSARTYNSPLREQQARRTAEQILDALVELAAAPDFDGLSVKELARHAGVAERTVYRHFPDRLALIDALAERDSEQGTWPDVVALDDTWCARFPAMLQAVYRQFDELADENRALARLSAGGSGPTATETRRRFERFTDAVADAFPGLSANDQRGVAALLQLLGSSRTWLRFQDEWGMSGAESGRYVAWLAALMLDHLETGGRIPELVDEGAPD